MNTVKEAPTLTPEEVQVIARALAAVIQMGTELSRCAQVLSSEPHTQSNMVQEGKVNSSPALTVVYCFLSL